MKRIFFLILVISTTCMFSQSPTNSGNFTINGTVSFSEEKQTTDDVLNPFYDITSFAFSPQVGYFVIDKLAIGLTFNYNYWSIKQKDWENSRSSLGIGPNARYYLLSDQLSPFITTGYLYYKMFNENDEYDYYSRSWNIGLGLDYFVAENVAIEGIMSYSISNITSRYRSATTISDLTDFGIGIGLSLFL